MNKNNILKLIDDSGKQTEYEILLAFRWFKTHKNYIVYTDNTKDEQGDLNVFASIIFRRWEKNKC